MGGAAIRVFLNAKAEREENERSKAVEMSSRWVGSRQERLAEHMDRRALRGTTEVEVPWFMDWLKQVEEMPWFFGLDKAPPEGMSGQELVRVINTQGGLGSTDIVLSD